MDSEEMDLAAETEGGRNELKRWDWGGLGVAKREAVSVLEGGRTGSGGAKGTFHTPDISTDPRVGLMVYSAARVAGEIRKPMESVPKAMGA